MLHFLFVRSYGCVSGVELSFFSGVYSPSIGFTLSMGENVKQLVGLSGVFIGLGEVLGNDFYLNLRTSLRVRSTLYGKVVF